MMHLLVPEQASSFAGDIDFLIILVAVLGGFWLIVAEGVLFYFIFKFRQKMAKGLSSGSSSGFTRIFPGRAHELRKNY